MSFRIGAGSIPVGGTQRWFYRYPGGADHGAQYCKADPHLPFGVLLVNEQGKLKDAGGLTTYFVTVQNIGTTAMDFDLIGGGLT